jgi:hypothetical protein
MGGINDIREAFKRAAPAGTTLKNVTMMYDVAEGAQVFTFEIGTPTATRAVTVRIAGHATPEAVAEKALRELGIEVIDTEVYSNMQTLVGGGAPILRADTLERDGTTYELVEDGVEPPKPALFF